MKVHKPPSSDLTKTTALAIFLIKLPNFIFLYIWLGMKIAVYSFLGGALSFSNLYLSRDFIREENVEYHI